jgi:LysM repeat protein
VTQLQAMNNGVDLNSTTKLVAPRAGASATSWRRAKPESENAVTAPQLTKVKARKGDTIAKIAAARNLNANEVARLNGVTPDAQLKAGQEIKLPAAASSSSRRR